MDGCKIPPSRLHQAIVQLIPVKMGFAAGDPLQSLFHFLGKKAVSLPQSHANFVEIQVLVSLGVPQGGALTRDEFWGGTVGQGGQQIVLTHGDKTSLLGEAGLGARPRVIMSSRRGSRR